MYGEENNNILTYKKISIESVGKGCPFCLGLNVLTHAQSKLVISHMIITFPFGTIYLDNVKKFPLNFVLWHLIN